ncbi:MAG: response regulator [Acidobacteriota bacterium]
MPIVTIFSGAYCHEEEVVGKVVADLGYRLVNDEAVIAQTASRYAVDEEKLRKAVMGKASIFNKFTHEKERSLAHLEVTVADMLREDNLLFSGYLGFMIPREISHVLKVCLIADIKYRTKNAAQSLNESERDAARRIHKDDESRVLWTEYLMKNKDPWAAGLHDIVIPMDKQTASSAASLIVENARKPVLRVTDNSRAAVEDFILAAGVKFRLAEEGHYVSVSANNGNVVITIEKNVLMLSSLEEELKRIVGALPRVRSVETRVGAGYYQNDIYRKFDFDVPLPTKVLLVDDEREFVQTLSERLQMRDVGSAVVYDGQEALDVMNEEEPEVMVLDLKMPGIDGIEVLRRVRDEHPNVEVIVLTGHGSEEIRRQCLEMGACAYLEKPVDIETLTRTMKEAYERIRSSGVQRK